MIHHNPLGTPASQDWLEIFYSRPLWSTIYIVYRTSSTPPSTPTATATTTTIAVIHPDSLSASSTPSSLWSPPRRHALQDASHVRAGFHVFRLKNPAAARYIQFFFHNGTRKSRDDNQGGYYTIVNGGGGRYVVHGVDRVERVADADIAECVKSARWLATGITKRSTKAGPNGPNGEKETEPEAGVSGMDPNSTAVSADATAYCDDDDHDDDDDDEPNLRFIEIYYESAWAVGWTKCFVLAKVGHDGVWAKEPGLRMTRASGQQPGSWFQRFEAKTLELAFTDGKGDWDNNHGNNYHLLMPGKYYIAPDGQCIYIGVADMDIRPEQ